MAGTHPCLPALLSPCAVRVRVLVHVRVCVIQVMGLRLREIGPTYAVSYDAYIEQIITVKFFSSQNKNK